MDILPDILQSRIKSELLKILVFGPNPSLASNGDPIGKLAKKRIEIRQTLRDAGHTAEFPEELLVGSNTPPPGQLLWYEDLLIQQNDLVILLAESPGANAEVGYIAGNTDAAKKTQVFINERYSTGLVSDSSHGIELLGGKRHLFKFPDDLDFCHLKTKIEDIVFTLQRQKYFS